MSKTTQILAIRCSAEMKRQFNKKASRFGNTSAVHREIIQAFIDGRLTLEPNPNKPFEDLYNELRK